jgi:hypothetical protein
MFVLRPSEMQLTPEMAAGPAPDLVHEKVLLFLQIGAFGPPERSDRAVESGARFAVGIPPRLSDEALRGAEIVFRLSAKALNIRA